jgi:hypothetical protein
MPVMSIRTSSAELVGAFTVTALVTKYAIIVESTMTMPPIVGVPRLTRCDFGPSSRIG